MCSSAGEVGALATLEGNRMRLTPCSPHYLFDELVRLAGLTAGPGRSVTVRAENLDAAALVAGRDMHPDVVITQLRELITETRQLAS